MADSIVEFRARMTEAEYDRERAALRETYGDSSVEAAAKRDQALARLFARSNWTQEELAKKEGKSQSWVDQRLRFGRFLNFTTTVVNVENLPKNLTERLFRQYWDKTEGTNERARFMGVLKLGAANLALRAEKRRPIGRDIIAKFGDGKWHSADVIAREVGATLEHVEATFHTMAVHETYGANCERKQVGKSHHYRIFPKARLVSSSELTTKLGPILDGLKTQAGKSSVTVSVPTIARLAGQLQSLIDEWTK